MTHRISLSFLSLPLALLMACSAADTMDDSEPGDLASDETTAWEEAYEESASGKADEAGCSGVIVPDRNGFAKRIALTFDDGPNAENTPRVLEVLAKHEAVGTFFVNGKNLSSTVSRELAARMLAEGHILANHSQNHLNLKTVSSSKAASEVSATHQALKDLGVTPRFFRFPFGSSSCSTAELVRSYGYAITGWHIDSADWCYNAGGGYCKKSTFKYVPDSYRSDFVGYVLSQAKSTGGGVLLFHDVHGFTANHLDEVLTALEGAGFTFVPLSDADTFPKLNGAAAKPATWIGTACADDSTCAFSASGTDAACLTYEGGGFCSMPCEGYCPDKAGTMRSFCVSVDGTTGQCVAKAGTENHDCADIPGTTPTAAERFVGSSTATVSTATVCLPQ